MSAESQCHREQSFEELRPLIEAIVPERIELAENKSVSYHAPAFFLEVIPRKERLDLLFKWISVNWLTQQGSRRMPLSGSG